MEEFKREKNPFIDTFATAHELKEALNQRVGIQDWRAIHSPTEETIYFGTTESGEAHLISSRDNKNMFLQSFPTIRNAEEFLKGYTSNWEKGEDK